MRIRGWSIRTRNEALTVNTDSETVRAIAPVSGDDDRPFWSVMIPVHGCGPQLETTRRLTSSLSWTF